MTITIEVSDHDPLVDEIVGIVIRGLSKQQAVTVHGVTEEKTLKFGSCACFIADDDGVVDLTKHESLSGTYTGVSPMGLFWSMKAAPGEEFGTRLIKSDASAPLNVDLKVCEGHLTFEELYTDSPKVLASLTFRRWYKAKDVRKIIVRSGRLRGALFLPPETKNVILKECEGHLNFEDLYTDSPKVLASLAFRRWYKAKDVRKIIVRSGRLRGALFLPPETKKVILKECEGHLKFEELYTDSPKVLASLTFRRWYKARDVRKIIVRSGRLRGALFLPPGPGPFPGVIDMFGVVGALVEFRAALLASRGFAALALPYFCYDDLPKLVTDVELEYFLEAIHWLSERKEVVSDSIGLIGVSKGGEIALHAAYYSPLVKAIVSINGAGFFSGYPMKYQGNLIGEGDEIDVSKIVITDEGLIYRDAIVCGKEKYIPIWERDVKVLLVTGEDDQCLDPAHLQRLHDCYPTHKKHNCRLLCYPRSGHLIEPPYSPLCRTTYRNLKGVEGFEGKMITLWGGKTEEHAVAQEDSWKNILHHFRTHLSTHSYDGIDSKL